MSACYESLSRMQASHAALVQRCITVNDISARYLGRGTVDKVSDQARGTS